MLVLISKMMNLGTSIVQQIDWSEVRIMIISVSRYTPNLKNGKYVHFEKGETVSYRMRNGEEHRIKIVSDIKQNNGYYGYEAVFDDDGKKYFAVADGIYDWEGKVN